MFLTCSYVKYVMFCWVNVWPKHVSCYLIPHHYCTYPVWSHRSLLIPSNSFSNLNIRWGISSLKDKYIRDLLLQINHFESLLCISVGQSDSDKLPIHLWENFWSLHISLWWNETTIFVISFICYFHEIERALRSVTSIL